MFENKIAVVTGGSRGIGAATALRFAKQGAEVFILDVKSPNFNHDGISYLACNVANFESVQESITEIYTQRNRIDHLFASSGVHYIADIENSGLDKIDVVINTNLKGAIYTLKAIIPVMKKQGKGTIVLTGSDQTFVGKLHSAVYGATKAAIGQLVKSTALEYADFGIRVNCVCPGPINTDILANAVQYLSAQDNLGEDIMLKKFSNSVPIKRIGEPEEVAAAVLFLSSDDSSFITGELLKIDGGYTAGVDRK